MLWKKLQCIIEAHQLRLLYNTFFIIPTCQFASYHIICILYIIYMHYADTLIKRKYPLKKIGKNVYPKPKSSLYIQ